MIRAGTQPCEFQHQCAKGGVAAQKAEDDGRVPRRERMVMCQNGRDDANDQCPAEIDEKCAPGEAVAVALPRDGGDGMARPRAQCTCHPRPQCLEQQGE